MNGRTLNTDAFLGHWLAALWIAVMIVIAFWLLLIPILLQEGWHGVERLFFWAVACLVATTKIASGEIDEGGIVGDLGRWEDYA